MNTQLSFRLILPLLGLGAITGFSPLLAQNQQTATNDESTNSAPGSNACHGWRRHHDLFANLSDDEREQLKADMLKIKDDPQLKAAHDAVKQALDALQQTRKQLLLQVDPGIQPILDKLQAGNHPPQAPLEH